MLDLRQLLRARSAYAGRFDADGERLLFVSDLGAVPQVCGVGTNGVANAASSDGQAWPEMLVAPPDRAQTIYVGPRAGQLVVGADVGGDEHTQLLMVPEAGASWEALTDDPKHIHNFGAWRGDGRAVSFSSNVRSERWFDVYVQDVDNGQPPRLVMQDDSTNRAGPFSPDGRWLLVTRAFSNARQELWLVDLQGSDEPRRITSQNEEAVYERPEWSPDGQSITCLSNLGRECGAPARIDIKTGELKYMIDPDVDVDEATLDPTGRRLAYALNRDGAAEILVRELTSGREERIEGLPPGALYEYWQDALAWDATGERLSISWTGSTAWPNVWVWSQGGPARQVTAAGGLGLDATQLSEPEHVTYPTFDGRQIPALFYPGSTRGPCVVFVHGGPEGQFRPTWQPVVQYLVSAGFSVLAPNVRGSSGYGKTYLHLDDVRLRMDSVADLAHAAYWLRDSGRADPSRIAVYGGSYGGFMVLAALTTYPELWAAGVDLVGIANFVTFLENTGPWRRHLREAEYGSLENDRDFLVSISPINKVDRIRAPLVVIHGANDPRVPISETEQMVGQLRSLGRTVEFLRLEDEGHQIAKLKNKLVAYPMAVEFLREHLGAA
ncbi:MAG: S9 family peptidase [Chloroflexi bacterium]|nr:S9 family peptidase [Chloroflexota bacterium]